MIFADEPTGNLDSKTTAEVMELLEICVKEFSQTLVMITHSDKIAETADKIITISDGKIVKILDKSFEEHNMGETEIKI